MSDEGQAAGVIHAVDERLRIVCQMGQIAVGVEHQQVVLLRITVLVVDLLSDQEQDTVAGDAVISLHALDQHIMVRHDDGIHACFDGGMGDILVCACPVGVACMHVQIDDDFVHLTSVVASAAVSKIP